MFLFHSEVENLGEMDQDLGDACHKFSAAIAN